MGLLAGGVRVSGMEVRRQQTFDALVYPGCSVPPASTRFHGITDDDLAGARGLDVVLPAFLAFAGDAVLVGHEVAFDLESWRRRSSDWAFSP